MIPRAEMDGQPERMAEVDEAIIPSHQVDVPVVGPSVIHPAKAFNVLLINVDQIGNRIAIVLVRPPCECGCGEKTGKGLSTPFSPDGARDLAAKLIELADRVEGEAAATAAAALDKVFRK